MLLSHSGGMAQRPWHKRQRLIRHDKRIGDHARLVVDHVGVSHPRQYLHGEYFLDGILKLHVGDGLARVDVYHPDAAATLGQRPLGNGDAAKLCSSSSAPPKRRKKSRTDFNPHK